MSAVFEDDVEPLDEPLSRSGNAGGGSKGGSGNGSTTGASSSRIPSPEPDEDLDTTEGKQNMWLVKVPRFLLEGWTKVDEEDKCLGTVRVYDADHKGVQRMELHLPQEPEPAIPLPPSHPYLQTNFPRKYDMRLTSEQEGVRVKNLYAFKERLEGADEDEDDDEFDSGTESKYNQRSGSASIAGRKRGRRVVSMVGKIANEASVKPQIAPPILRSGPGGSSVGLTPEYREVLRKRRLEAQKPRHSVKVLDDSDRSRTNMLTSGVMAHTNKSSKASLIAGTSVTNTGRKSASSTNNERFARLPRNELLDMLFELYDQYPYWSIKGLRQKVQQPEVYLRDVLSSIADLHKRGPYSGNWSLKPEFVEMRKQQDREAQQNAAVAAAANAAFANALGTAASSSATTSASSVPQHIAIGGGNTPSASSSGQQGQGNSGGNSHDAGQTKAKEEENDDEDEEEEDDMEMEDVA